MDQAEVTEKKGAETSARTLARADAKNIPAHFPLERPHHG